MKPKSIFALSHNSSGASRRVHVRFDWIGSLDCLCLLRLARLITFVLFLRHNRKPPRATLQQFSSSFVNSAIVITGSPAFVYDQRGLLMMATALRFQPFKTVYENSFKIWKRISIKMAYLLFSMLYFDVSGFLQLSHFYLNSFLLVVFRVIFEAFSYIV